MLLIKLVPPKLLFLDENHFRIAYQNSLVTEKYNKTGLIESIYLKKSLHLVVHICNTVLQK